MPSNLSTRIKELLLFSILFFILNTFLHQTLISNFSYDFVIYTHLFFVILTSIIMYVFDFASNKFIEKSGFVFIFFFFLKIILIICFLAVVNRGNVLDKMALLNFSLVYLGFLFFSIYLCLKTLKFYQKNKN